MINIIALGSSSKGNCYMIDDGSTKIMLECGLPYREIQKGFNFQMSSIAGCLVSHEHSDHSKSVKDVLKAGIDVYSSEGTFKALNITHHRAKQIKAKEQFQIGTWTILPFETEHDTEESLGFLLVNRQGEKLLFATDTYYIKYRFQGLNFLMIECNYSLDILNQNIANGSVPKVMKKRLLRSHFSLENVKEFLKANDLSKVQEVWLLHLSDSNSNAEQFKREVQELTGKMVYVP
jgi:phosphoribosyl 1,2-cyclic phosphodiesterase